MIVLFLFLFRLHLTLSNPFWHLVPAHSPTIATRSHRTTTARRARSHYLPDDSPSFYRRDLQGGLNRAPVSGHSMEFLRGIYAFMQVSRSSVSVYQTNYSFFAIIYVFPEISCHVFFSFLFLFECPHI